MNRLKSGFTLIEVSLVIVLIAIIIAITTPLAIDAVTKADLNSAYESLYGALLRAQKLSKTQDRGQQWLLCIDNTSKTYTIAAGSCSSPVYKETVQFASHITITSSPSSNVGFASVTGNPMDSSINSAFNFTLSSGGVSKLMGVNKSGVISKASLSEASSTPTSSIVTNGLVLNLDASNIVSYPGLSGNGSTWFDLSGNGNNGTLVNGVGYNSGNLGSLVFDGVNDYATVSNNITPGTGDFAVSVWVYKTETVSNTYIWDFGANGGTLASGTSINSGFRYYNPTIGTGGSLYNAGPVHNINTWYNIVISRISGTTYFYSNGSLVTSGADGGNIGSWGTTLNIGRYGGGGYIHQGNLSSLLVYKGKGLTPAEIQQNFNATKSRFGL